MISFPYEEQAVRNEPAPDYIPSWALHTYHAMALLYERFRYGKLTKEQGSAEKKKILRQYEMDMKDREFMDKLAEHRIIVIRNTEKARNAYRQNRTLENADRLVAAIDGLDVIDIINPAEERTANNERA